jgi:hypothetical protein
MVMLGSRRSRPTVDLSVPDAARNETRLERLDRNLVELLQEVRVVQTGVQVLFGFLLTVPFTVRFDRLTSFERIVYFGTLLSAGAAAMLLIAPSSQHRVLFRRGDKEYLIAGANNYAIAGLAAVALAMIGAILLISSYVFGPGVAVPVTVVASVACAWCWFAAPLLRRRSLTRQALGATRSQRPDRR